MPIELVSGFLLICITIGLYLGFWAYFQSREHALKQEINDLEKRNELLKSVWEIQHIIVTGVDSAQMGEKIVHALQIAFEPHGYLFVFLLTVDSQKKAICTTAASVNKNLVSNPHVAPFLSKAFCIPLEKSPLFAHALEKNEMTFIEQSSQLFNSVSEINSPESAEMLKGITTVAFPLVTKNMPGSVLLFGANKRSQDIPAHEIELMQGFAHTVGIALENASLYSSAVAAKEELSHANDQLKELDKLKDEFVSLASHELRTPMTAIQGSISTILDGYAGEINPQAKEFLTAAYNENDRLIRLVNNLLNISRIEAGRLVFELKPLDFNQIAHTVVANLQMAAKEKGLTLSYTATQTPLSVRVDEDKLKEVLVNLVGNALKFTHKGGVTINTSVKDTLLIVNVTDTGSGIAQKDQELLFKKFSQVKGDYAKQTGGTGLGLYICKKIVEGMGGTVWLSSQLGQGSTFSFSLPIASESGI